MAGTVTWKRSLFLPYRWQKKSGSVVTSGDPRLTGNPAAPVPTQVTTSFRTSGEGTGENDEVIPEHRDTAFRKWYLENRALSNPLDSGHPFSSTKTSLELRVPTYRISNVSGSVRYDFPLYEDYRFHSSRGTFPVVSMPDLNWYGARAIANTLPTNPVSDMATALGEFVREGLPRLIGASVLKSGALFFRELGGEYLNIEFGWKPFVQDVRDLLNAVVRSEELVRQYVRDSGRVVRRRYRFPTVLESLGEWSYSGALASPDNSSAFLGLHPFGLGGQVQETLTQETQIWFSGAYSYYLENGDDLLSRIVRSSQKAKYLLGIRLTPEVLWNLMPWSWLIDWVSNVGDVLHNIEALSTDGLVIRYGYLMCTRTSVRTCTLTGVRHISGTYPPVVVSYRTTRKERIAATPYGFGLPPGLTDRQKAILAALLHQKRR